MHLCTKEIFGLTDFTLTYQPPPSFSQRASSESPPPPPSVRFLEPFQPPQPALPPSNFIGISPAPSAPSAPPLVPENSYLLGSTPRTTPNNLYGYQTQT